MVNRKFIPTGLEELERVIWSIEPTSYYGDKQFFDTALVLMAAIDSCTFNSFKLHKITKLDVKFIQKVLRFAKENEIMVSRPRRQGYVIQCNWMDEELGSTNFLLDVMCCMGLIQRTNGPEKTAKTSPDGAWVLP